MIASLLTVVALLVRITIAAHGGLWRDEALFVAVARMPSWPAMLDFLQRHESHPPLFYAVERVWLSATGDSDGAAVALPVLLGALLVPAIYWIGKALFSQRVGLIAAALTAFAPALAEHSALARPYSLLPLLVLCSSYALIRGIERGGRRNWGVFCVATLALLYTHNWTWLVVFGQWLAVGVSLVSGLRRRRASFIREWLLAQGIVAIGYLPWVPWLLYQSRNAGHAALDLTSASDAVTFVTLSARALLQATVLAFPVRTEPISTAAMLSFRLLPLMLLAVAQFFRAHYGRSESAAASSGGRREAARSEMRTSMSVLLVTPFGAWLLALLVSPFSNMMLIRCLVMLAPLIILAFANLVDRLMNGPSRTVAASAFAMFIATYAVTLNDLSRGSRTNAKELAAEVASRTHASDLVIIAPEWLASSFNRYYDMPIEQIDFPHFGRETAVDFAGMRDRTVDPQSLALVKHEIADARRTGRRVWLMMEKNDVGPVPNGDLSRELRSPNYGVVAKIRANQIRSELTVLYGVPDTVVVTSGVRARFEQFQAFLFTPRN